MWLDVASHIANLLPNTPLYLHLFIDIWIIIEMTTASTEIARRGYVPAEDVAKLFGVTKNCLAKWRSDKAGPAYYRLAGRIYYHKEDLEAFIKRSRVSTAAARQDTTNKQ